MMYNDVLIHHGILGQKWGVRRFQNKDGSLTAAGRRREARNITKRLNEMDKSTVMDKRSYHEHNAKATRYANKINKLALKKQTNRRINKIEDLRSKKSVEDAAANMYRNKVLSVENKIHNLVDQYDKQGYTIKSELVSRNATKGAEYAVMALQAVGQMALSTMGYSSLGFYGTNRVVGTKYKAKYDKQKQIAQNTKMTKSDIKSAVETARKTGKMDIDFVEKIQNNEHLMNARNDDPKLLSEYEKYLRNK